MSLPYRQQCRMRQTLSEARREEILEAIILLLREGQRGSLKPLEAFGDKGPRGMIARHNLWLTESGLNYFPHEPAQRS